MTRRAAAQGTATLGQRIRAAREARGLTQADLAARAHVAQAYLSYLEHDQREPSLSIAARLARELDMPLDELANNVAPQMAPTSVRPSGTDDRTHLTLAAILPAMQNLPHGQNSSPARSQGVIVGS